jgi:hypothetical protein
VKGRILQIDKDRSSGEIATDEGQLPFAVLTPPVRTHRRAHNYATMTADLDAPIEPITFLIASRSAAFRA